MHVTPNAQFTNVLKTIYYPEPTMDMSYERKIRILQCNIQRSISAAFILGNHLNNYDLVLLQEPYCRSNAPACLPTYCPILQGRRKYPWAVTLVPNVNLPILHHTKFSDECIIVTELLNNDERVIIINTYFPGEIDNDNFLGKLQHIIDAFQEAQIVLAGDLNAHSPAWGGNRLDGRGRQLEEFLNQNDLLLLNNPFSPLTFCSPRGESWIDVAICSSRLYAKITNWRVLPEESLSDHAYVTFNLIGKGNEDTI
ncbi:uncharacterized protein LOC111635306 [Centruroides sculpturatus]|uniref:uncharacterized protein LOC111635306 n=1 Tax=Centruroides sculpturatus TaxID=218467 RepID=UPI000C6E2D31|nr:uncharacterized protein LOC111635306 [Centruroides sculpturatus]